MSQSFDEKALNVQRLESYNNSPSTPSSFDNIRKDLIATKNKLITANQFRGNTKALREYKTNITGLNQIKRDSFLNQIKRDSLMFNQICSN